MFLCLIAIITVGFLLHLPKRESKLSWKQQLPRIDILGALLLILTVTSLLYGLDRGSNVSWRDSLTISCLCATLPLSIAFVVVEARFAVEPFAPARIIFDRGLFACYAQNFFEYAAFTSLAMYLPLYFQGILGMSPIMAGASLVPLAVSAVLGTLLGGIIVKRTGKFYWLAVVASIAGTLGTIPIVIAPSLNSGSLTSIFVGSIAGVVPQGITITASLIAISTF